MQAPLIVHVIHALGMGGLENGLVNLINRFPPQKYRHAIVCMTCSSEFGNRLRREDVTVYSLYRDQAHIARTYWELYRLFKRLKPALVHGRNLSGLDGLVAAFLAGVPVRVHGEHGRDVDNLDGMNARQRRLKKLLRPLVSHYTAVSRDLADYLVSQIGISPERVTQIYNGVDTEVFAPARIACQPVSRSREAASLVIGTVGRLQPVKDQLSLVKAFMEVSRIDPEIFGRCRLVIAGEGPCRPELESAIAAHGLTDRALLLGARDDVPSVLRTFDVFALPSLAEGISNTVLEAMATGLPVVATRVGGNADLIEDGRSGVLIEVGDTAALAAAIVAYARDEKRRTAHGHMARRRAESMFSLQAMVDSYADFYDRLIATHRTNSS